MYDIKELVKYIQNYESKFEEEICEPWFYFLECGQKKVEGRLDKGRWNLLKTGDLVIFKNNDFLERRFTAKIVEKRKYNSFREYLEKEKNNNPLPCMKTIEHQLSVYYKYFTHDDEKKYGVIAIEIEVL